MSTDLEQALRNTGWVKHKPLIQLHPPFIEYWIPEEALKKSVARWANAANETAMQQEIARYHQERRMAFFTNYGE